MKKQKLGLKRKTGQPPATPKRSAAASGPSRILDNRNGPTVGEFLRAKIVPNAEMRVVSAYFSIYAHQGLSAELEKAGTFRFLFGDYRSIGSVDAAEADLKRFLIKDEDGLALAKTLEQKYAAQQCEQWMARDGNDVRIRTMENEFLHGKMFHILPPQGPAAAVCGSSNFTARGLGFNRGNRELNLVADPETCEELQNWFDRLWGTIKTPNPARSRNVKDKVLDALRQLGKNQDPEFIYFLTLYRLFHDELEKAAQNADDDAGLTDSAVWNALYPFQKDAVHGVVRRLKRWGGCILADSVGLGKTYTALAVVKHFQNQRILVLCPKRLMQNWTRFIYDADGNNPLEADQFNYRVQAHTDLGRENLGRERKVPDWSKYDLVVIDESHNFRNAAGKRYQILLDALRSGARAKVLMLSATPVNTALKDIRNQIHLMADDDAFGGELGIDSVKETVRRSQAGFAYWEKNGARDKDALMENLGGAFLKLMDAVSIARNRKHVRTYYAHAFVENGGTLEDFPRRAKPETRMPETDRDGELSYARIHRDIENFGLSVYRPSAYLKANSRLRAKLESDPRFKQTDREKFLIGMLRVNFLKRLESSAHSFCLTLDRTIGKIEEVENKIAAIAADGENARLPDLLPDPQEFQESDDLAIQDFMVGKGLQYDLREMRLDDWSRDLKKDRKALEKIRALAGKVTPDRDAKLAELKKILRAKAENPPLDKDGKPNRKALIFTAFSDTAAHIYQQLRGFARRELSANIALVVGSGGNRTTAEINGRRIFNAPDHPAEHADILNHFAPRARGMDAEKTGDAEIDILVATDCVSEGQNLQDCDMVINYDIHWNPVRIIQRFGRVDRIGGRNREVRRVDFWPHMKLDEYLKLRARVHARMALAAAVAAGDDGADDPQNEAEGEIGFRDEQLRRLQKEALTSDDLDEVSISDFTMADFLAELRAFLQSRRHELKSAPDGLFAVVESDPGIGARPGIIFCLKQKNAGEDIGRGNPTHPHCLAYVCQKGGAPEVRLAFPRAKKILRLFGDLCREKKEPLRELCAAFDREIENGKNMLSANAALTAAVADIIRRAGEGTRQNMAGNRAAKIPAQSEQPGAATDFELVSWLVIRDGRV